MMFDKIIVGVGIIGFIIVGVSGYIDVQYENSYKAACAELGGQTMYDHHSLICLKPDSLLYPQVK